MNNENLVKNLEEVFKDEAFIKQLLDAPDVTDVQKMLEERGVELTTDQIAALGELIASAANGEVTVEDLEKVQTGELSDDDLENVAGGCGLALGSLMSEIGPGLTKAAIQYGGMAVAGIIAVGATIAACVRRSW